MTTLNKLIEHLTVCRDEQPWIGNLDVFLAEDGEGNGFRPTDSDFDIMSEHDAYNMLAETRGYTEGQKAIILWPTY